MADIDWSGMFVPSGSIVVIAIRGTIIYLALFLAMRFLPRRTAGAMGPSDLLVVVLIADAVQNAMSGGYESITEGAMLAFVIFGWATLIDWLDYRFPHLHIAEAAPRDLVVNGKLMRKNMGRQLISEDEVMAQLRHNGQESLAAVARVVMEGDGSISVILRSRELVEPADRQDF